LYSYSGTLSIYGHVVDNGYQWEVMFSSDLIFLIVGIFSYLRVNHSTCLLNELYPRHGVQYRSPQSHRDLTVFVT
jgi:hypothetical protein